MRSSEYAPYNESVRLCADVRPHGRRQGAPRGYRPRHRGGEGLHHLRRGGEVRRRESHPRRHGSRSEEHTSELQSLRHLVCRLLLEKKKESTSREGTVETRDGTSDEDVDEGQTCEARSPAVERD